MTQEIVVGWELTFSAYCVLQKRLLRTQNLSLVQPAMLMHSENWDSLDTLERNYGLIGTLVNNSADEVIEITLKGTKHYDFSSLPLLSPLTVNLGLKGPIDGGLFLEIINNFL